MPTPKQTHILVQAARDVIAATRSEAAQYHRDTQHPPKPGPKVRTSITLSRELMSQMRQFTERNRYASNGLPDNNSALIEAAVKAYLDNGDPD